MADPMITCQPATAADAASVLAMIRALAAYEGRPSDATLTEDDLHRHLFGEQPVAHALLARAGDKVVGMAIYYWIFATFAGTPGIYVEDLFIDPAYRGRGLGKSMLACFAARTAARGGSYVELAALHNNDAAMAFYAALGATPKTAWKTFRFTGKAFDALVAAESGLEQ